MQLEGTYHNGVIVPDDPTSLTEGARVRIEPITVKSPEGIASTFAERFADFCGAIEGPEDLATQHDHYRLGTPKR